jgi:cyclopropane fatty-acyl-phospholipid synthase-like methyltransferase
MTDLLGGAGNRDVRDTLRVLRQLAGPAFTLDRVLDVGCGDGESTISLAQVARIAVGIDESPPALDAARSRATKSGVNNVEFFPLRAGLNGLPGPFDVVHSFGAFERIPISAGFSLIEATLDCIAIRGGGMLHFVYGNASLAQAARRSSSKLMQRLMRTDEMTPRVHEYDLNRMLAVLHAKRFDRVAVRFTDIEDRRGLKVFFWRGY